MISFINDSVRTISYEDVFPVIRVTDDRIAIGRRGELTVGWRLGLPALHTSTQEEYDEMTSGAVRAVEHLPSWCLVHRQDVYTYRTYRADPSARSYLAKAYEEHYDGARYLHHDAYLFVTLCTADIYGSSGTASGVFGIRPSIAVPSERELDEFLGKCESFVREYCGRNISYEPLVKKDWLGDGAGDYGIVDRYMSMGEDSCVGSDIALGRAAVGTSRSTAVCFAVNSAELFPGEIDSIVKDKTFSGEHSTICTSFGAPTGPLLNCSHAVNQYVLTIAQETLRKSLKWKGRIMRGNGDENANDINLDNLEDFIDAAYDEKKIGIRTALNIVAWDSPGRIDALTQKVQSVISSGSVEAVRCLRNSHIIWYAGIPGAASGLGRENMLTGELESLMCLSNWDSFISDLEGGTLKMCDRITRVPVRMDMQELAARKGWIGNFNIACLGSSGTGKSFFVNTYLQQCYDAGEHVTVIDVGDSYQGQCGIHAEESGGRDGQYHTWDNNRRLSFNPFVHMDGWLKEDGSLDMENANVNFFLSLIQTIWSPDGGWSRDMTPILYQFIRDFVAGWRDSGNGALPVFDDFYSYVAEKLMPRIVPEYDERGEVSSMPKDPYIFAKSPVTLTDFNVVKFVRALASYAGNGPYAYLLNNHSPADLSASRFSVYEVAKISETSDKTFYSVVVLCIVNIFDQKMRSDEFKKDVKILVIEEAWKAIANETMAPYIRELWKTSRKYNTSAMVVTQEVKDILGSDIIKDTILSNSDIKVLLDQSSNIAYFDRIQELYGLTQKDKDEIFSMNKGKSEDDPVKDVFIKFVSEGAERTGVFRTEVSGKQAIVFESKFAKKEPFIRLAEETGSYMKACDIIYQQKLTEVS